MSGFAQIPKGARGLCTNTFDFTGIQGQSYYSLALPGPIEGPYTLSANPDVVSWSPCGGTTAIMNMNTQCNISPTREQALIAVSSHPLTSVLAGLVVKSRMEPEANRASNGTGRSHQRQGRRQRLTRLAQVLKGLRGLWGVDSRFKGKAFMTVTFMYMIRFRVKSKYFSNHPMFQFKCMQSMALIASPV
jgi:hypothetical protein